MARDPRLGDAEVVPLGLVQAVVVTSPAAVDARAVAELEFFTTDPTPPDPETRAVLQHAAAHLKRLLERDRATAQLRELALHDGLTGLANRALFNDRLQHALQARRHGVDVVLLDLDDFKNVNDVLGHHAGDVLLVEIGRRLLASAGQSATVARLGGDEFAIVLEDAEDPKAVAQAILAALTVPVQVDRREIVSGASVGIARAQNEKVSASELLRRADIAMYVAKAAGKNQYALFVPDMKAAIVARADLELALRDAAERGEMVAFYQPIVDARAEQVVRVEVVVRWQRPTGLVSPAEFLPVAEQTGLIVRIGDAVLAQACRQLSGWLAGDPERSFAVNASVVELRDPAFARRVLDTLAGAAVPPTQLVIEVTETLFLDADSHVIDHLVALREAGVRVAVETSGRATPLSGGCRRFLSTS